MGRERDRDRDRTRHLAYTRSLARLRETHRQEFDMMLAEEWQKIAVEQIVCGAIEPLSRPVRHQAGSNGLCVQCGRTSPCLIERRRQRGEAVNEEAS